MIKSLPVSMSTLGRATAGKTTLAQRIAQDSGAWLVSESAIKRTLIKEYRTEHSLDENLRDIGYEAAAAAASCILSKGISVLVDATYHLSRRRQWLLKTCRKKSLGHIFFYCKCDQKLETERRIVKRQHAQTGPDTQANTMEIFNFIDSLFEEPLPEEFFTTDPVAVMLIKTDINDLVRTDKYGDWSTDFEQIVAELAMSVKRHLSRFRSKDRLDAFNLQY